MSTTFLQGNPGFLILYSFIKDALLSKVGVVKIFWEENEERERETYLDQPEDAFAAIVAAPDVEIIEHTVHDGDAAGPLHDVTIETRRRNENARVVAVPPEEFGISRHARTIAESTYCFHDVFKTQSQLIDQGFNKDQVKKLPSYIVAHTIEEIARDTVDESTLRQGEDNLNTANRLIRVTEHYVKMDYEGGPRGGGDDPRLYRVTTAGEEGEVLIRDGEPDVIEEDRIPFAAITPVIVTHRFSAARSPISFATFRSRKPRSCAACWTTSICTTTRASKSQRCTPPMPRSTISWSRVPAALCAPGSRVALNWQEVPDITGSIYPALQYLDATREWRTGVSRQGQGVDPDALQNQVATIANQMFSAAQGKVKLIARIFAETGIKDLFTLLHATIRKHATQAETVRLRNQWVRVDPRDWKTRNDMTINVGLGTGTKAEQLAHLQLIIGAQTQAITGGLPIVSPRNLFNSAVELAKLAGHKDFDKFFMDPAAPPNQNDPTSQAIQKPPDPKQTQIAAKAQAEQEKIKADAAHQQMKAQADIAFQAHKAQIDAQLAQGKAALETHLAQQKFALDARLKEIDARLKEQEARASSRGARDEPGRDGRGGKSAGGAIARSILRRHRPLQAGDPVSGGSQTSLRSLRKLDCGGYWMPRLRGA